MGRGIERSGRVMRAPLLLAGGIAPLVLAAGCASFPSLETVVPDADVDPSVQTDDTTRGTAPVQARDGNRPTSLRIPGRPAPAAPTRLPATDAQIAALIPDEPVDAILAPQSIPEFAATVFGGLLGVPYTLSPEVATRQERIAGGTGGTLNKRDLFRLTQSSLRQYGIEVYIDGAFVTVGASDTSELGANLTRGRAAPTGAGRVVQFFPVQTIEVAAIQPLLESLFPNLGGARITPDNLSNTLIISGSAREVGQVVRALTEIDQPRFAGAEVVRIEPIYSSADVLAGSLENALATEGYVVSRQAVAGRAITILTFPASNQILAFTKDPVLAERVRFWVDTLDRPASLGEKQATFVYTVRNTDAASLGQLAMGQAPTQAAVARPVGVPGTIAVNVGDTGGNRGQNGGAQPAQGSQGSFLGGRVVTDPIGNRILFTGTATEYAQLRDLLLQLDTPAPQVVIEVMIAEVTLTDMTDLGISFGGSQVRGDGIASGVVGNEDLGVTSGVLATFVGPEFRARLTAEASNSKINILQRPQLVTRSGLGARFQAGSDVPIITSQRATDTQNGNDGTDILQSVQYRQTGTITELTPVVYGDRVDITINQEISSVSTTTSGAIASPTILNRSLSTQVSVADGGTAVLGGLITNNAEKSNFGVPFLKDIPVIGSAFQNNSVETNRTEILMIVTPYIIRNDDDMAGFTDRYTSDMNDAFEAGRGWSYTLTPFSTGRFRGVGVGLPGTGRPSDRPPARPIPAPEAEAAPAISIAPPPPPPTEPIVPPA